MSNADASWFSVGYEPIKEAADNSGGFRSEFRVKEGETAVVRYLTDIPFSFSQHDLFNYRRLLTGRQQKYTCRAGLSGGCPLDSLALKPRVVGALVVYDYGLRSKDSGAHWDDPKDAGVKMYIQGVRVLTVLERLKSREGGLLTRDFEIMRTGTGSDTQYAFIPRESTPVPAQARNEQGETITFDFQMIFAPKTVEELNDVAEIIRRASNRESAAVSTTNNPPTF